MVATPHRKPARTGPHARSRYPEAERAAAGSAGQAAPGEWGGAEYTPQGSK